MTYKQESPFCIQVEMTKGCNLQCTFCGINGFQDKPNSNFNFVTLGTAERIAEEIAFAGWTSRIEFAMHGEPTKRAKANIIPTLTLAELEHWEPHL